ncbi:MAG: protein-glutamate O-methyltransferase CheR [Burkholderiaceae bacterium]|nr:protein-glutamate O-methyltransferase CheR [Burkholderiaceae bacterium]
MRALPGSAEITRFSEVLADLIGMQFAEAKHDELGKVLHKRMQLHDLDCEAYLVRLTAAPGRAELAQLARELTVTETYFMRHIEQFQALAEVALPERIAPAMGRPMQILSAGCSSGEEAYSIAMILRERFPQAGAVITALDLNPAVLQKAAKGQYGTWSLRACPEETRARWFRKSGELFELDASLRSMVRFEERNLTEAAPEFWHEGRFDIVFCRNILMYFSPEQAQAAVARIAHAMAPGAYLFLGHAETLRGLSNEFHLCHTHNAFYYSRKNVTTAALPATATQEPLPPMRLPQDTSWFEAIQQAAARVHALTAEPAPAPQQGTAQPDTDALLLQAVNASHDGKLDQAEALCHALLEADDMNAGAHYVLALCREGRGDPFGASEHGRIAAYLDPGFAMPRLHLGLALRRMERRAEARIELEAAAALLQLEDPARVLLFGGGFRREALIALCRAELAAIAALEERP